MKLTLEPVRVANGFDEEGMLVFTDQHQLVAVLTHLSDRHEGWAGHWYLEAGFGQVDGGPHHPTFGDLDAAQEWIARCLSNRFGSGLIVPSNNDPPSAQTPPGI